MSQGQPSGSGPRDEPRYEKLRRLEKARESYAALQEQIEELERELADVDEVEDTEGDTGDEIEPLWDDRDYIYRCNECLWEVIDGECQGCGQHYLLMDPLPEDSISTSNEALNPERTRYERGDTPLGEHDPSLTPLLYKNREDEYEELISRGATRLMCETFDLQFLRDIGIVAWADQALFDEFSNDKMKEGNTWKIHLGRSIQLDEEDLDGSLFIEELLEDAILFPLRPSYFKSTAYRWETVEARPGQWETKPLIDIGEQIDTLLANDDPEDSDFDSDCTEDFEAENDRQERALENPYERDQSQVVVDPGYESTGSDSDFRSTTLDDEVNMHDEDMGWTIDAKVPDAVYSEPSDNSGDATIPAQDIVEDDSSKTLPVAEVNTVQDDDVDMDDDSEGSDFDSDELCSGDEYVVARRIFPLEPLWFSKTSVKLHCPIA